MEENRRESLRRTEFLLVIAVFFSAVPTSAQTAPIIERESRDLAGGVGRVTFGPVHLESVLGANQALGCAHLLGEIFISSSNGASGPTCYVLDSTGASVRSFQQSSIGLSARGWRDGASDGAGTLIWGSEAGFAFVDVNGASVVPMTVNTANGPRQVPPLLQPSYPLDLGPPLVTLRAVAFNPSGNQGDGSIWSADFGSDLIEFNLDGVAITRLSSPVPDPWSIFGLAWDPEAGRLWANGAVVDGRRRIVSIEPITGDVSGQSFSSAPGAPGGLDYVLGGLDGRMAGSDLLSLSQGRPDLLTGHRLDLYDGISGASEPHLIHSVDSGIASDRALLTLTPTSLTWSLDLDDGIGPARPVDLAAYYLNTQECAIPNATAPVPAFVEYQVCDAFTAPTGMPITIGTTEHAGPLIIGAPPLAMGMMHGERLRVQVLYVDLLVPGPFQVMFTNQVRLAFDGSVEEADIDPPLQGSDLEIVVRASGGNSFNSDVTSGFWSICNDGNFTVLRAQLALPATLTWDVDQVGMADSFLNGNSLVAGCQGTFRNGSEVVTGLAFSGTGQTDCDPAANRGFRVSGDSKTLTFWWEREVGPNGGFGEQELFEWDADTDGPATGGADHAGTIVTLTVEEAATENVYQFTRVMSVVAPNVAESSF